VAKVRGLTREGLKQKWLDDSLAAIKSYMGDSMPLSEFMKEFDDKGRLSKADRLTLVEQALILLEMNYVHLPQKRAMHGTDPVLRLRRLRFQLGEMKPDELPGDIQFHAQMQRIFTSARDIHTNYTLPAPFKNRTAYLPFLIEEYFDRNAKAADRRRSGEDADLMDVFDLEKRRFLVSHVATGLRHATFKRGVEVLYWNGVPINRAIEINGERQAGSNLEARFAHGMDSLTIRPFNGSLPPEEMWVVVSYRTEQGKLEEIKLEWRVYTSKPKSNRQKVSGGKKSGSGMTAAAAMNPHKDAINRARKLLFAPGKKKPHKKIAASGKRPGTPEDGEIKTRMPDMLRAMPVKTTSGDFGYIRIFNFRVEFEDQVDAFVNEFARLLKLLPNAGLIIDVRGNGGGDIAAAERILQLLTSRRIKPTLFEVINTPLNLDICRALGWSEWAESISQSALTGSVHSQGFPITSEDLCNNIGRVYFGPVVLITDALCYSATDMFAASFQDHEIGEILGTSGRTGAGGANVLGQKDLTKWLSKHPERSPFKTLPKGVSMRVAFRRSIRAGKNIGRPLEELGVVPDRRYYMTRDDLLYGNRDLIARAGQILSKARTV
jgi:hypothetical protein